MSNVLTCTNWNSTTNECESFSIVQNVYLFDLSQAPMIDLILNGGFDPEAFGVAFSGILALFAAGAATGIIISQVRKLK